MKKFFIIAGEPSGDVLGGKIIKEIKAQFPSQQLIFEGVGGKNMKEQGLKSLFEMSDLSVMGFFEVLPKIFKILSLIKQAARAAIDFKPDYFISIDSPDFSFRVAKKLKKQNFKKVHIIAPSVWAYREGRAKKISKLYNLLLAILPFEPPYFLKHNLKTVFIGHPIVEEIKIYSDEEIKNFRKKNNFNDEDILIYTTAGSRVGEVLRIFKEFIKGLNLLSTNSRKNIKIILPTVEKTKNIVEKML